MVLGRSPRSSTCSFIPSTELWISLISDMGTVMACVRVVTAGKAVQKVRTFDTTTRGLLALCDWLSECGCTHAAMESTGVYWKPVWHVLEGSVELVLANASHIRNVPGRKTDVSDAMWIADLLAHGLIRASFVPPTAVQELRDLTRTRKQLVRGHASITTGATAVIQQVLLALTTIVPGVSSNARLRE